jgi:hypothetical protein
MITKYIGFISLLINLSPAFPGFHDILSAIEQFFELNQNVSSHRFQRMNRYKIGYDMSLIEFLILAKTGNFIHDPSKLTLSYENRMNIAILSARHRFCIEPTEGIISVVPNSWKK